MSSSKPRIIIAGQVPPPFGGQNIMIQKALAQFVRSPHCETVHLPFFFTPNLGQTRKGSGRKLLELVRVIFRLLRIRGKGPIDLLLFPTGGPQRVPMIRDILLLPWVLMLSQRVVLHFHAAGIADQFARHPDGLTTRTLRWLYSKTFGAVVMTGFNSRDPAAAGINRICVVPYHIGDDFDSTLVSRADPTTIRLLYVGHLCADKGTPQLIEAVALLRRIYPNLILELVGECLPPFSHEELSQLLDRLDLQSHVQLQGLLTGKAKAEAFGRADLFVFPSVAPYESFGLVLVEAMSWELPIVASKWRGNAEVLTTQAGAICFPVTSHLVGDIRTALEAAIQQRNQWKEWGTKNRSIFEDRYKETIGTEWLVKPLLDLMGTEPRKD